MDLGCGYGEYVFMMVEVFFEVEVIVLDFNVKFV